MLDTRISLTHWIRPASLRALTFGGVSRDVSPSGEMLLFGCQHLGANTNTRHTYAQRIWIITWTPAWTPTHRGGAHKRQTKWPGDKVRITRIRCWRRRRRRPLRIGCLGTLPGTIFMRWRHDDAFGSTTLLLALALDHWRRRRRRS